MTDEVQNSDAPREETVQNNTLGVISLVIGILGIIFSFLCCPFIGIILGVIALVTGLMANSNAQKFAKVGLILGIIAIIGGAAFLVLAFIYGGEFLARVLGDSEILQRFNMEDFSELIRFFQQLD